ncbi:MAG TPA: primosomal protein N', partial [Pirellulales bacterium]
HETTFKQETAPRYHAREVALERAKMEQIPLILGSATPSLESWSRATSAGHRLIQLRERVKDRPLPPVGILDLRQEFRRGGAKGAISRQLRQEMEKELTAGNQVILMLNRRGFSTHLQCPACGHVVKCKHCDIALTYHRTDEILMCHYCDHQQQAPNDCPECRIPGIRYGGIGTQKLEQEVQALFPDFPCLRMDADAMQGPGSHERALAAFRSGDVKILLGTQMIAKGLDFPNVTLVGVVNADLALHLPDFRAAERTFQLLAQVAGRAGRGDKGGRVLVQTYSPDHPAIQAAARHDFEAFTQLELPTREAFAYPPFGTMTRVVVRGPTEELTSQFADQIAEKIRAACKEKLPDARILGPAPAPLAKLRDKFRFHLQVHAKDGELLRQAVKTATADLTPPDELEWIVDVDPLSML